MFRLAVTSTAFSKSRSLCAELEREGFLDIKYNGASQRWEREELIEALHDRDAAILGMDPIDDEVLRHCPSLRLLSKFGVGLDNVDLDACRRHSVEVVCTPGVNRRSVSEQALGSMLFLFRNLYATSLQLRNGIWNKDGGAQLSGKTVGIIGLGNVGRDLVALLQPFGCRILVNDIIDQGDFYRSKGLIEVEKGTLLVQSDVVTIHTPLTPETEGLVDRRVLAMMKPESFLINTARGGIVVEDDLKWALETGEIAGAAIDVFEHEPPTDPQLLACKNLIATPHVGGNAREAVLAMGRSAIEHVVRHRRDRGGC